MLYRMTHPSRSAKGILRRATTTYGMTAQSQPARQAQQTRPLAPDILASAVGSPAIAAWIAEVAFWCLFVYGFATGEMNLKRITIFLLMWLAGRIGLPYVSYS
jgi:hypothetical protein